MIQRILGSFLLLFLAACATSRYEKLPGVDGWFERLGEDRWSVSVKLPKDASAEDREASLLRAAATLATRERASTFRIVGGAANVVTDTALFPRQSERTTNAPAVPNYSPVDPLHETGSTQPAGGPAADYAKRDRIELRAEVELDPEVVDDRTFRLPNQN